MAVRNTLQVGNPILKAPNQRVVNPSDPQIQHIIKDMIDTMHKNNLIGLAAPQIGENYHLFITEPRETKTRTKDQSDDLRIYINPTITKFSDEKTEIWEGCGCVANGTLFAPVIRPKIITITATNINGKEFQIKADGILGRVIQHENDHLSGIEFTEKISDMKRLMSKEYYIEYIKPVPETTANSLITIKEYSEL
ncbi:MAG: peptide deformylase [bacterium]